MKKSIAAIVFVGLLLGASISASAGTSVLFDVHHP